MTISYDLVENLKNTFAELEDELARLTEIENELEGIRADLKANFKNLDTSKSTRELVFQFLRLKYYTDKL